jgi:hypothetical protein
MRSHLLLANPAFVSSTVAKQTPVSPKPAFVSSTVAEQTPVSRNGSKPAFVYCSRLKPAFVSGDP